jgi:hypothetical protein
LIDANHPLACAEPDGAKGVADKNAGSVFLGGVHGVLEVEDDGVRLVQTGIDKVFRFCARQIEAGTTETIAGGRWREGMLIGKSLACGESGATGGSFNTSRNGEGEGAFVMDEDSGLLDGKGFENLAGLSDDRRAIIRGDAGFETDVEATGIASFDGDVEIGANVLTPVSGFGFREIVC